MSGRMSGSISRNERGIFIVEITVTQFVTIWVILVQVTCEAEDALRDRVKETHVLAAGMFVQPHLVLECLKAATLYDYSRSPGGRENVVVMDMVKSHNKKDVIRSGSGNVQAATNVT